ncbi:LysR substrate-binding domain-containing protein [Pelagibius sp.]|uniref:LysR substrate-binding domain-containing protein n=1 Tax=Pelagibius sp. TaxID=1931238 RepID=UPI00260A482C|nr:LysR substrate-binding domain-containing protein [Pelagibius sp.]
MDWHAPVHYPRPQLDLELLRTFVAAVEAGSFTGAGHRIGRSQSTISNQISKLEALTKARLLVRSKQGVAVTAEGAVLLGYARDLLRIESDAVAALRLPVGSGKVRLGTQEGLAVTQLPPLLNRFMRLHSAFEIEVVSGMAVDLTEMLRAEQLDLVLMRQPRQDAPPGKVLWREPILWVGHGQLLQRQDTPLPLAVYPAGCFYREAMLEGLAARGIEHRLIYTAACTASLQAAVLAGLGVSAFAAGTIGEGVPVLGPASGLPALGDVVVRLYRSKKKHNTAAEALGEFIERSLRPTPAGMRVANARR